MKIFYNQIEGRAQCCEEVLFLRRIDKREVTLSEPLASIIEAIKIKLHHNAVKKRPI